MSAFKMDIVGTEPDWTFAVRTEEIETSGGVSIGNREALVRADSGDVIALHSDRYRIDPYLAVAEALEDGIVRAGINTKGATCRTNLTHNGGRLFRQYDFPAHEIIVADEDKLGMQLLLWTSYDGSRSNIVRVGSYRYVCENMMVAGTDAFHVRARHLGEWDVEALGEAMVGALANFETLGKRAREWSKSALSSLEAYDLFSKIPRIGTPVIDHMTVEYLITTAVGAIEPATLWTAANVATRWATHGARADKHPANAQATRLEQVARWNYTEPAFAIAA